MPLRGRRFRGGTTDRVVASVTRSPTSIDGEVGDVVTFSLQAKNAAGQSLTGKVYTAVSASPSIVHVDLVVGRIVTCTILAETSGVNVVGTCETVDAPACSIAGTDGTNPTLDAELQPFGDGDYDNGYADFYDLPSGFFDGTEVLVGSVRLGTPAIASIEASDDIILDVPDCTLDDRSVFANDKGYRITKPDHSSGAIYGSAGPAGTVAGGNDPNLVVADPDTDGWFAGDVVPLAGAFHVRTSVAPDAYDVSVSTTTPNQNSALTATAQTKRGGSALHRIGIALTPSWTNVSGTGDGSITESTLTTNKNGVSQTAHATTAHFPSVDTFHVTDGAATGDSAQVTVNEPMIVVLGHIGKAGSGGFTATTDPIDSTDADCLLMGWEVYSGALPVTPTDSKGNSGWTKLPAVTLGTLSIGLAICKNPTSVGSGHTATLSGGSSLYTALFFVALKGMHLTSPYNGDQVSNTGSTGPTVQPGSLTPPVAKCLVVSIVGTQAGDAGTPTINAPFTALDAIPHGSSDSGGIGIEIQSGAAVTRNPTWDYGSTAVGAAVIALIASFQPA